MVGMLFGAVELKDSSLLLSDGIGLLLISSRGMDLDLDCCSFLFPL